jgi:hypothetical protein
MRLFRWFLIVLLLIASVLGITTRGQRFFHRMNPIGSHLVRQWRDKKVNKRAP